MMTRSAGRPAAASRGGGTSGRGGRTRGRSGDQGDRRIDGQGGQVSGQGSEVNDGVNGVADFSTIIAQQLQNLLPTIVAQIGDQGRGQRNGRNQNSDAVNDNIRGDLSRGCTHKDFLACNPKEYDGKGGSHTVELLNPHTKLRSRCRFHEFSRLVPHLVTPEGTRIERYVYGLALQIQGMVAATEPKNIQKAVQIVDTLTDEALRNGSIKKNHDKRGNRGEPNKDRNVRDDNKRTRTRNAFATTTNPVGRENTSTILKCTTCNTHYPPEAPCHTCFNCNRPSHFAKDCRVGPKNVSPIKARNPTVRACYECGSTDHIKSVCPRAFMLGVEEARQNPNIVTGTFTLNDHYATTLFNSGAEYNFVFTTFIPLLRIEPNNLGFSYEIEIASEQLVEIDKREFDVIIGMDSLSDHKAKIICHEKVVRIPLLDGKVLRVFREKPGEKVRQLMSVEAKKKKQEEIVVVKDFPEVFQDDLSGLPPVREIKFRIELFPRAMPVTKSPYRLAPSELEELSGEHEVHLGLVLELLKEEKLYAKFSKTLSEENAFQTLKDKLCNARVLALLDGPEDFVVYCDVSGLGLGCVLMQRDLFSDYDCEIRNHPGKANVIADAMSRKERVKPMRVRAINMTLQSSIKDKILAAQKEAFDEIAVDFVTKLPRTSSGHDTIWVIMDRLTKSAHFLPMREDFKMDRLARLYLNEIVSRHGVSISIISDRDSHFTSRFWQSMQEALGTRLDISMAYHPQNDVYDVHRLRLCMVEIVIPRLCGLRLEKKSYADKRRKPLEVSVGDYILLKVSPWKGVVRFEKKGKLAPRFFRPFEIIEKVGPVGYRLDLPEELNGVHDTFHVSNLKKCLADPTLQVLLDDIRVDAKLNFMEEPVEILKREFKKLKRSKIVIVKVWWNSKCGPEFTWEREDQMKLKRLFKLHQSFRISSRYQCWSEGKLIKNFTKKESMKKAFKDMLHRLGEVIQLMHITVVPEQVKPLKIQAGVQVSIPEDTKVIFSTGSTLEDFIFVVFILVRNIVSILHKYLLLDNKQIFRSGLQQGNINVWDMNTTQVLMDFKMQGKVYRTTMPLLATATGLASYLSE
uniref:Reverse transcriptase domain-containing protein n=1 Tax=Tanacetum cinerariifolium TaxID=118510 RepID=A0A6L2M6B6_TANCI|nr:reverse transcriptase domain-containing protein [Tanacetum cinerariifolium]